MTISVEKIAEENFDINTLLDDSFSKKKDVFCNKASAVKESLLQQKRVKNPGNSYLWISDEEVISAIGNISDEIYLLMIFDKNFLYNASQKISNYSGYSWHLINHITDWIARNDSISKKIIFSAMVAEPIKNNVVCRSLISIPELISDMKNKDFLLLPYEIQDRILELSNPEDVEIFTDSPFEKIRLNTYKKIGPIKHLDKMIKDTSAVVRLYAVNIISPRDQRLGSFVNDRSSRVFEVVLSKIHSTLIPMMVGSNHLKKRRIKALLQERMNSAQS